MAVIRNKREAMLSQGSVATRIVSTLVVLLFVPALVGGCSCDDPLREIRIVDAGQDGRGPDGRIPDAKMDDSATLDASNDARAHDAQVDATRDGTAPDAQVLQDASVDGALDAMPEAGPVDAMVPDPLEVCSSADTFTDIAVGSQHICAIRSDGALLCWGSDNHGQLGDGTADVGRVDAMQVGADTDWTEIAAGKDYACGIRAGGLLYCWGANDFGQLGVANSNKMDRPLPTRVGSGGDWRSLSAGGFNACAIQAANTYCWGHGASGRLGTGNNDDQTSPAFVVNGFDQVVTGGGHSCATVEADGRGRCWGGNGDGQLGVGSMTPSSSNTPLDVDSTDSWSLISTGSFHTCAVRDDNALFCWGSNGVGQLGLGDRADRTSPMQVGSGTDWVSVSAGSLHSCAVDDFNALYCWGSAGQGQLGTGGGNPLEPVLVRGIAVQAVDASGSAGTCALTTTGQIYCWGDNSLGQLGFVSADAFRPVRVCP